MRNNTKLHARRYSGYLDKISTFGCVRHSDKMWRQRNGYRFRIRNGTILMMVLLGYLRVDGKLVYMTDRGKNLINPYREEKARKRRAIHLRRKELRDIGILPPC